MMRSSTLVCSLWQLLCLSACLVGAYPGGSYDYGTDLHVLVGRQVVDEAATDATAPILTTGATGGTGVNGFPPVRQEMRDMEKNDPDMWTLYILALDMMQYMDQTQLKSWYQIAGIHGRPYTAWDNVAAGSTSDEGDGYCNHISILFTSWHRPFLALYEQILYGLVQTIAAEYPTATRARYQAAAVNFRIPYWDWAAIPPSGESVLPPSVSQNQTVPVAGPNGVQVILNPLYSYSFKPLNTSQLPDTPLSLWNRTMRAPSDQTANAVSQNNVAAQNLDASASSFRQRLYILFSSKYSNYANWSNEAWIPANTNWQDMDSIESLHDQIHGLSGSGGHMTYIDYSAWDPIFFLHHAMIDRAFAMWQVLYPNSYVVPQAAAIGTWTIAQGQMQDVNTALTPFYRTSGTFWNSQQVRDTTTFGYTYAETSNITGGNNAAQLQVNVRSSINNLYSPSAVNEFLNFSKTKKRGLDLASASSDTNQNVSDTTLASSGLSREWIANIRVKKNALSGPFNIHVFVGNFSENPLDWNTEDSVVGTHCIFANARGMGDCAACDDGQIVTGTIPLTERLSLDMRRGVLGSLGPVDVEGYLLGEMGARMTFPNNTEVPNSAVPSLGITIVSSVVQLPSSEAEFPTWGPENFHFDLIESQG